MARSASPLAPRVSPPDLPPRLEDGQPLSRDGDYFQLHWSDLEPVTDAAHATITECRLSGAALDRLDLSGASLVDVELSDLRATTVTARASRWRRVRATGGRIGTLDLADADLDEVELRGVRIDYLSLAGGRITDLLVTDCMIGSLDLPQAGVTRTAFSASRAQEVDTRGLRAKDLDLRGLDALSFLDAGSLRGATLSSRQIEDLAPALAAAAGIHVVD
jgi:uncharacterized protein YjbI with pentapeptide repeats